MALPENVAVRYTEDEAEYLSLRPVVRQNFRIAELVDMIVTVTGLDAARVAQILRSGAVVYHGYRYWWPGFEAEGELGALLAAYPVANASRAFDPAACSILIFESSGAPARYSLEVWSAEGKRRRFLRFRSFWQAVMDLAVARRPSYVEYSYARRADIFELELTPEDLAGLGAAASRYASRGLAARLGILPEMRRAVFVTPR